MRGFRMTALALLIGAGVFLPAGAATAQRVVIDDGTADVWASQRDEYFRLGPFTQAGSVANVDVVSTTVSYTRTGLRVTAKYADLTRNGPGEPDIETWLKLADGSGMLVRAALDDGDEMMLFFTDETARPGGRFQHSRCPDAEVNFNFRADTGTVVLPLSCIPGDSHWVKFYGASLSGTEDPNGVVTLLEDTGSNASYYDDPIKRSCFWQCAGWTKVRKN
jgi:hypothetical protein